jgi:hypothetical protein
MDTIALDLDVTALQELPQDERAATDDLAGAELQKCDDTCYVTCIWTCSLTWW